METVGKLLENAPELNRLGEPEDRTLDASGLNANRMIWASAEGARNCGVATLMARFYKVSGWRRPKREEVPWRRLRWPVGRTSSCRMIIIIWCFSSCNNFSSINPFSPIGIYTGWGFSARKPSIFYLKCGHFKIILYDTESLSDT